LIFQTSLQYRRERQGFTAMATYRPVGMIFTAVSDGEQKRRTSAVGATQANTGDIHPLSV